MVGPCFVFLRKTNNCEFDRIYTRRERVLHDSCQGEAEHRDRAEWGTDSNGPRHMLIRIKLVPHFHR